MTVNKDKSDEPCMLFVARSIGCGAQRHWPDFAGLFATVADAVKTVLPGYGYLAISQLDGSVIEHTIRPAKVD